MAVALRPENAKNSDKANSEGSKSSSVVYEYLFDHGFIGFLAWIPLIRFLYGKPNEKSTP